MTKKLHSKLVEQLYDEEIGELAPDGSVVGPGDARGGVGEEAGEARCNALRMGTKRSRGTKVGSGSAAGRIHDALDLPAAMPVSSQRKDRIADQGDASDGADEDVRSTATAPPYQHHARAIERV